MIDGGRETKPLDCEGEIGLLPEGRGVREYAYLKSSEGVRGQTAC